MNWKGKQEVLLVQEKSLRCEGYKPWEQQDCPTWREASEKWKGHRILLLQRKQILRHIKFQLWAPKTCTVYRCNKCTWKYFLINAAEYMILKSMSSYGQGKKIGDTIGFNKALCESYKGYLRNWPLSNQLHQLIVSGGHSTKHSPMRMQTIRHLNDWADSCQQLHVEMPQKFLVEEQKRVGRKCQNIPTAALAEKNRRFLCELREVYGHNNPSKTQWELCLDN